MHSFPAAGTAEFKKPSGFLDELREILAHLNDKGIFLTLFVAWVLLFQYLGSAILAYTKSYSLFDWCFSAYNSRESEDGHGNLIPFAVLGLLWWKRKELIALPQRIWPAGLLFLAFACLVHFAGYVLQVPHLSVLAFALGAYALVGLTWGPAWLKATFFPFFLLIFCVPTGPALEPLTFPLRIFATWITYGICHGAFGINVIRRGTELIDPLGKYDFDVAAACSGIRSLVALTALTVIYSMVFLRSWWRRAVVIFSAIPLALLCNVLRLVCVVLVTDLFGEHAGQVVHEWFGFVTYLVALGGAVLLSSMLEKSDLKATH